MGRRTVDRGGWGCGRDNRTLVCIGLPLVATQFAWSIQTAFATTLFKQLGASQRDLGFLRIPGPVTGLFVQPLSGLWTDWSGYRYRPATVLAATLLCGLGFVLLPLGEGRESIWTVFVGCCFLDVGFNVADALVRVLVADVTERDRLPLGNSIVSSALGAGQLGGFVANAVGGDLARFLKVTLGLSLSTLSFACVLGLILLVSCDLVFLWTCTSPGFLSQREAQRSRLREEPREKEAKAEGAAEDTDALLIQTGRGSSAKGSHGDHGPHGPASWPALLRRLPPWMAKLCVLNALTWLGWFCFIFFAPDFIGISVLGGDPHAPKGSEPYHKYREAQTIFSYTSAISSCIMVTFSWAIPFLVEKFGMRHMLSFSSFLLGLILVLTPFLAKGSVAPCVVLFSLLGFPWSMTMSLPYAVVSALSGERERGKWMGVLNVFVVLPSFCILGMVGVTGMGSQWVLLVGAATAVVAAAGFFLVPIK